MDLCAVYTSEQHCCPLQHEHHQPPGSKVATVLLGKEQEVTASFTEELDLGNWKFPTPFPVLGMYPLLEFAPGHSLEVVMW